METKKAVFLVLILIVVGALIAIMISGFTIFGEGYKVTMTGSASYSPPFAMIGEGTWTVSLGTYDVFYDNTIFSVNPAGILSTGSVVIEVALTGGEGDSYKSEVNIGEFPSLGGDKPFSLTFRHVNKGIYIAEVNLYQMEGGFFGIGAKKVLKSSSVMENIWVEL